MKVQYRFVNGDLVDVEVPQEYGEALADLDRLEHNNNQTQTRRHVSLDMMVQDQGVQFVEDGDVSEICLSKIAVADLIRAMDTLTDGQKELIHKVFEEKIPPSRVAEQEGVSRMAINNRLNKIYHTLRKMLD